MIEHRLNDFEEGFFLTSEVQIESAFRKTGFRRDVFHLGAVEAAVGEHGARGVE
jgi:hypothetical protein